MNSIKYTLLSFVFILFAVASSPAQSAQAKEIDALMNKAYQLGIFNGNILVMENGKPVYQSSFGYSDASKKTKLTADYRFNIGSIGKEFNAVAIMILKEQGKLAVDDKISKYLSFLPSWAEKISIKNLLQYTSGLPDIKWKTIKSDTDILNDLKALKQLDFEPGTNYAYNNTNVFLQRRIVEKISGLSFQKFVETKMLQPCGMTESIVDPDLNGKNIAISFNNDLIQDSRQFSYVMSGWTAVTTRDLYKWSKCVDDHQIINQASLKEILIPFLPGKQASLGGGTLAAGQVTEHSHQGSSFDFEALLYSAPSEKISIILLTNNMNFKLFEIKDAVKSILRDQPYQTPKKSILFLLKKIDDLSAEEIIKLYDETKTKQPDDYDFKAESDFNQIGYHLMNKKRLDDAIKIFELNVKTFPTSANAYDSLAEAYFNKGDKKSALTNYQKSLALDPKNSGAQEMIDKLKQ